MTNRTTAERKRLGGEKKNEERLRGSKKKKHKMKLTLVVKPSHWRGINLNIDTSFQM